MRILVTGGNGYIGSHTVTELQQQGFKVLIADNLCNSSPDVPDKIEQITGIRPDFERIDLSDPVTTSNFFRRNTDIGSIIHFAALKAVGESMEIPLAYYRNNVVSLINILEGMKNNGIRDIVFSSSCTVYGQPDELPVSESAPVKPACSPYGHTKQICEEMLRLATLTLGIRCISLRYFNPVGAHDSALIGELPLGVPNNLVPFITQTAAGLRECLSVFGGDYATPDGSAQRDYLHVTDLAGAHIKALNRLQEGRCGEDFEIFNLGTGKPHSVLDVIRSFEKISGMKLNYRMAPRRAGDVEMVWADTRKANDILGWTAQQDLDSMMASAWKWQLALQKA